MALPQHFTLAADTEKIFTLDQDYGQVRIVVYANPAVIYFNTRNAPVPAVATGQDGNHVVPPVMCSVEIGDDTGAGVSVVRMRSAGSPTVMVTGI